MDFLSTREKVVYLGKKWICPGHCADKQIVSQQAADKKVGRQQILKQQVGRRGGRLIETRTTADIKEKRREAVDWHGDMAIESLQA